MIIQFDTPAGPVLVDTQTVTDAKLAELGITRDTLSRVIPRDLAAEVDDLKTRVTKLEKP